MTALISVVVLTHGAGADLTATLESIRAQTHREFEALVMDDGTGTTAGVELPDNRFRLIRAGAPSRGAARNLGAAEAAGEYLAFVDGGDMLPTDGLRVLAESLDASGSDFAAGNVNARYERVIGPSRLHKQAFARTLQRTQIARHQPLLQDRYVSNKLFRKSFWDDRKLAFPDVSRYEDLPVAMAAHHLATAVDVLQTPVVVRRESTWPEHTSVPQEVADGFAAVSAVFERLDGGWRAKERDRFQVTVLNRELEVLLDSLPDAADEERAQIVEQAAVYVAGVDVGVLAELPALTRLKWHLASRRLKTELVKVVRFERGKTSPAIVRDPIRRYVVYPYWKDDKLAIPREVYRARDEVALRSRVHDVSWVDGGLRVTGEAYINSVSMRRRWTSLKGITLRSEGRRPTRLRARQTPKPGKTSGAWTGFEITIDPRRLRRRGRWADGDWDVLAAVFNSGVYRKGSLRGGGSGSGAHPPYHYVAENVRIVPLIVEGDLRVRVETVLAVATALHWTDKALEIQGSVEEGAAVELTLSRRNVPVPIPVTVTGGTFSARMDLTALDADPADPEAIDDTRDWSISLNGDRLVLAEGVEDAKRLVGDQELVAGRDSAGYVRIQTRTTRMTVTACSWRPDGTFELTGTHPVYGGATDCGEIVVRSRGRRKEYAFGLVPAGDGTALCAVVPAAAVATLAGVLPLRPGRWDVLFRPPGGRALAVRLEPAVSGGLPSDTEVALRGYTLESHDGRLVLNVTGDLKPEERGAGGKLREEARRRVASGGLRDTVLFSCFSGRQYSDSPRAIHEELVRRGSDLRQLWVVNDAQVELPGTLEAVRFNGAEWHEAMASSRYIIANHRIGDWFQRHPDQVVLQTWHGTPLKKIGSDVKEVHFAYAPGMKKALQSKSTGPKTPSLAEWSYLLSPNAFSTKIMRRAFGFKGEIIEAGYPRNDVLYSPDADAIAASVRARIGIPPGKKVVLYAPTWRDDQYYSRGRYKFDMRLDLDRARAALGDDHVLLVRLHSNIVDGVSEDGNGFVYDVSLYPEISELYLIADLMVTDYSSVMFDYAGTRRPMLFFTYDLPDYRDRLRGFYFDFEKEAPGPLVETSDALIEAIRAAGDVASDYAASYDAFVSRFCPLDDGKASARVVDRVFPDTP
jgi:CDP-glycerol glycerophosphotransferase